MRIAYLDCFSGISGDMMLGALVHAGVDVELLRQTVRDLGVEARLEVRAVERNGIGATKVDVIVATGQADDAHLRLHRHEHEHEHHRHEHGRSWGEIESLISSARIAAPVQELALRAFRLLAEAEARIHNRPMQEIHFHEVGAVDAIVDIVCSAAGCVALGIDRWICSPVNTGGGTVQCAHGVLPVPAPATAELLKGARVYNSGVEAELVTPTGAAIVRALQCEFAPMPEIAVACVGYGAGGRDLPGTPNVVRLTVGETAAQSSDSEVVTVIETAVDDLTPEVIGYVMEQALAAGALDAMAAPVQMKKSRPGHLLTVLCRPVDTQRLGAFLLRETSALGIRVREERRRVLERQFETVATRWGGVRVKLGYLDGGIANCAPEFEDCRRIAQQHGVPLKTVMQEAIRLCAAARAQSAG